jgi:RNA polymerase sigma-70 factor (ECF subfamily)
MARDEAEPAQRFERHRVELTGYCYRMLGSAFDAEDAVQETLVRAWKGYERFEGRSALRSWLYRIATNVCLDMLGSGKRRALPMDLNGPLTAAGPIDGGLPEAHWITPAPDGRVIPEGGDPADIAALKDTVRLAFIAALQHLAPKQRVVLILREVLAWQASEVAELLDTSVASVNSALQRARATLAASGTTSGGGADSTSEASLDEDHKAFLARYVAAFEAYDLKLLTSVLHEDVTMQMPPFELWLRGRDEVFAWFLGIGRHCRGSRLLPLSANGAPAFAQYRPSGPGGRHEPWALQVLDISDGRVTGINTFLDTERFFPLFGMPPHLDSHWTPEEAPGA